MSDNLILDFPILKSGGGDFLTGISYQVSARQIGEQLEIKHTLKGNSFIRRLLENGEAEFSVLLLYRDSSERQNYSCETGDIVSNDNEIVATQTISIKFSYAPEIMPSIVLLVDKEITVDTSSGLTDFWKHGEYFNIPKYSRMALGQKLKFTAGEVSSLMKVIVKKDLGYGEMRVEVNENANEGETPVFLVCGKGVYDELHKITQAEPSTAVESMRSAIVTQALCAVYAYMQNLRSKDGYESGGVLLAHLELLESKTGENWENENFNPSLAATKMQPYVIQALNYGGNHD